MNKLVINLLDSVSKNLINGNKINISELKESTVMITGASGFIGSMLANLFLYLNEKFEYNVKLILNVRDKSKLSLLKGDNEYSDFIQILEKPVEDLELEDLNIDYIFHLAAPTQSKYFVDYPVETADSIVFGIKKVLELSRLNNVKKLLKGEGVTFKLKSKAGKDYEGIVSITGVNGKDEQYAGSPKFNLAFPSNK